MFLCKSKAAECKKFMNFKLYKNLFELSPAVDVVVDMSFIIVTASNKFLQITGTDREHITGRNIFEVFSETNMNGYDDNSLHAAFNRVIKVKTSIELPVTRYEMPIPESEKVRIKYFNHIITPVFDEDNIMEYILHRSEDVTEQVLSNQLIEDSNNRYFKLLMQSPFAVSLLKGEDMIITVANELSKERLEIKEDIIGKSLFEVLPEIKDQPLAEIFKKVYTTGVPFSAKETLAKIKNKDGKLEERYFDIILQPYQEPDGITSGVTSIAYEVTELVNARKKAENSEHRYRTLIEESPIAIALYTGPEITVQYANHIMQDFWNNNEAAVGKPLIEVVPELEGQKFIQILKEVYDTGISYRGVEEKVELLVNEKLQTFYFNFTYTATRDKDGTKYGVLDTAIDVTEEVLARKALEKSEITLRRLLDTMPQKISQTDPEGNVIFFNQQWMDETGFTYKELQGDGWIKAIHRGDFKKIKDDWFKAIRTGSSCEVECRIINQKLGYRWNLSRAVPIKDETGEIIIWVASCTDIHEQKAQKEILEKAIKGRTSELELAIEELMIANNDLESFAYVSSHDLQEPLRKIQTFANLIRDKEIQNLSEKGLNYFERMEYSADRMRILIDDLLSFSRVNNADKRCEKIDLTRIVEDAIEEYKEVIKRRNATVEITELCEAKIIVFQFRQLMKNLISNALKFSKPDSPPHIIIEGKVLKGSECNYTNLLSEEKYCHISVADNGIGFDPGYSDRIFKVFQRLHYKDNYPGSGIGLAIVKKIVDNHHGTITVTSEPEKGTQFDIYIPAE